MKKIKIALLFLCVLGFVEILFSSSINQVENDSLTSYIKKIKDAKLDANLRLEYANKALKLVDTTENSLKKRTIISYKIYLLGNARKYDSAVSSVKILLKLYKKNEINRIAKSYSTMAYYFSRNHKKDSAYYYYKLSNDNYEILNDSARLGENLIQMAIIQSDLGDFIGGEITGIEALDYLEKDNIVYLSSLYNCLGISSKMQEDYSEALYWNEKALSIATRKIDSIRILNNKANILRYQEKYDASNLILTQLLNDNDLLKKPLTKARIIDNIAYTKWLKNKDATVLTDFKKVLEIRLKENDYLGLITSYSRLSDYYLEKDHNLSLKYAKKMLFYSNKMKSINDKLEALERLIVLESTNNLKSYYPSYVKLKDSMYKAEKDAKNYFTKLKFDTEKNRQENYLLKISNSEQEIDIQKGRTLNIVGAVSSGFILLLFAVFIYNRNQKHKQEKRAEVYQTETRIAKKIHDEVANNVVNIMNKIQYVEEPREKLLDDLEKVYLLTRNISHQNKVIETGNKYVDALKSLLTNFNSTTTTIILKNISNVGLENLSETKQIEIYRVLQELMVNMQKHSNAKLVALSFEKEGNNFNIKYSDNGVGAELNSLDVKNGLLNVETRIKSINGSITFIASLNKGFKAFISFK